MRKLLGIVATLFILANNCMTCNAGEVDIYSNILSSGKYQIDYEINYDVDEGGYSNKYSSKCSLSNDNSINLYNFDSNIFYPTQVHRRYYRVYKYGEIAYTANDYGKNKDIDLQKVKLYEKKAKSKTDLSYLRSLKNMADKETNEMFSMLGKITEQAGLLPNYKVNLVKSGTEIQGGASYMFDEYQIVEPYNAQLKLYYLNNELVKCIKIYHNTVLPHEKFTFTNAIYNGYVVVDIKSFKSEISPTLLNVGKKK